MELGFSKDGKLETFKDSDEIHVQIFLYPFYHGNSCNMKIYTKYIFFYSRLILRKFFVKFIYSEKATKFCGIFPLLLTTVHTVKSKGKISQNFVAFSEYMNFNGFVLCRFEKLKNYHCSSLVLIC